MSGSAQLFSAPVMIRLNLSNSLFLKELSCLIGAKVDACHPLKWQCILQFLNNLLAPDERKWHCPRPECVAFHYGLLRKQRHKHRHRAIVFHGQAGRQQAQAYCKDVNRFGRTSQNCCAAILGWGCSISAASGLPDTNLGAAESGRLASFRHLPVWRARYRFCRWQPG